MKMFRSAFVRAINLFKFRPVTQYVPKSNPKRVLLASTGLLTTITSFFVIKQEDIELAVKKAVVSQMRGDIEKAEKYFHDAIKLYDEQPEQNKQPIHKTNLFIYLANFYYANKDLTRSFRLFQECLRDLIVNFNYEQNNEAIIEISMKMSSIFAEQGDVHEAKVGYEFCLQAALSRLKQYEIKEDKDYDAIYNVKVLYVIISQSYGRYLCQLKEFKYSLLLLEQARILAMQLYELHNGEKVSSSQVSSLLNDLAVAQYELHQYEAAIETLKKSLEFIDKENREVDVKKAVLLNNKDQSRLGRMEAAYEAEMLKEQRLKLDEYKVVSLANMCQSHFALKQVDDAKKTCNQAFYLISGDEKLRKYLEREMSEIKKTLSEIKNESAKAD